MIIWSLTKSLKSVVGIAFFLAAGCLTPDFVYSPSTKAKVATASKSSVDSASVAAFESTVYPIVRQNCVGCHSTKQSPFFAAADVNYAHSEVINSAKVNFQNIDSSRLVQRLSADLHNCWTSCPTAAATMKSAIQQWADLRGTTTSQTGTNTATVNVPANLGTTAMVLSFPIAGLLSPSLAGGTFEISVVKFDAYSYRFFAPKIKSSTATAVYVKGINLLLNGTVATGSTTYDIIDQVVTTSTTGISLSTASMILEMVNGPGSDKVSVSFDVLIYGSGASLASQRFNTAKQMIQSNCNGCHSSQAPKLNGLLTEADFKAATFNGALLVVPGDAASSVLYKVIIGTQTPTMPPNASSASRTNLAVPIKTWIDQMAK